MITTDRNEPLLNKIKDNGQQEAYLVLSEEERAQGFIRPVRTDYVHIGRVLNYKSIHRLLEEEERQQHPKYVAIMTIITDERGNFMGGTYVTQEELDAWRNGRRYGGCGVRTIMHRAIAETYARNPKYYSTTFCCGCGTHLPVNEFIWDGTNEEVGS